jgi:toxin ParE1/3/4
MRYGVSVNAERDLEEIFSYWAERASLEIADRIIDKDTDRFWLLGEHPGARKASEGIAAGVKCFPAGKYLIYYRATRRGTDILHVFHGAGSAESNQENKRHGKDLAPAAPSEVMSHLCRTKTEKATRAFLAR